MNTQILKGAVLLGKRIGHIFVATADSEGLPHVAAAGTINLESEERVAVSAWFCPGTMANLEKNPRIALVVWDAKTDVGFQLLGNSEKVEEISVMDGYSPRLENQMPLPQAERKLTVRVNRIVSFKHAPHSDIEE
jgi:hypothetical protein